MRGGGRKGRGRTWKRKNSGQSKARALVSKGGSSDASVQATLCQPVHGTSFELNSFASMFYLFLSCPPPHCVMGFLHYRVCLGVVTFFAELIFPARTFHNTALLSYEPEPSKTYSSKRSKKTNPKSKPSRSLHLHEILEKRRENHVAF